MHKCCVYVAHCDPYISVALDAPRQEQRTSVVKNTANPFFDEHFVLYVQRLPVTNDWLPRLSAVLYWPVFSGWGCSIF